MQLSPITDNVARWIRDAAGIVNRLSGRVATLEAPTVTNYTPTTAPASPSNGMVYYDSGTNKLRVRAAGAWVDLH